MHTHTCTRIFAYNLVYINCNNQQKTPTNITHPNLATLLSFLVIVFFFAVLFVFYYIHNRIESVYQDATFHLSGDRALPTTTTTLP